GVFQHGTLLRRASPVHAPLESKPVEEKKKLAPGAYGVAEPGAGVGPFLAGLVDRDAEGVGDRVVAQPGEEAQLDGLRRERVFGGEAGERLVEGQKLAIGFGGRDVGERDARDGPAA